VQAPKTILVDFTLHSSNSLNWRKTMRKTRHTDYIMSVRRKNNLNGQNWQMAQEFEEFKVLADNNYGKSQKT